MFSTQYSLTTHSDFLIEELLNLLPVGSFAYRLRRTIGKEWNSQLRDYLFESEDSFSRFFPVDALLLEVTIRGGLDIEWLQSKDGSYLDDNHDLIQPNIKRSYSTVEQLAAYGLFLIDNIDCCGQIAEQGTNDHGFDRESIIEHQSESMLQAYKALVYAQKIISGSPSSTEEAEAAKKQFLSNRQRDIANTKIASDPKTKEKAIVFEWWQDWKNNPEKYRGKAAFARDMIKDLDHVTDVRTITDKWCPEWEKSHPTG